MKKLIFSLFLLCAFNAQAQELFSRAFGNPGDSAVIFLHGGPGYNCASFEATTAAQLASKGKYVIVYDRRGEGRSADPKAKFTFQESISDLLNLYKKYKITKATLYGHSFGGMLAAKFASAHPNYVHAIVLIGAPVNLQETFRTIRNSAKAYYTAKGDSANLTYLNMLNSMDTTSLFYSSYCFMHAAGIKAYSPKNPTEEAKAIYSTFTSDTLLVKYSSKMTMEGPTGFWKNEAYTTLDLTKDLAALKSSGMKIIGVYGLDDGLYSPKQIDDLKAILGKDAVYYLENCSHSVFVDRQTKFLEIVVSN
jgi:proline iminopeptidase